MHVSNNAPHEAISYLPPVDLDGQFSEMGPIIEKAELIFSRIQEESDKVDAASRLYNCYASNSDEEKSKAAPIHLAELYNQVVYANFQIRMLKKDLQEVELELFNYDKKHHIIFSGAPKYRHFVDLKDRIHTQFNQFDRKVRCSGILSLRNQLERSGWKTPGG